MYIYIYMLLGVPRADCSIGQASHFDICELLTKGLGKFDKRFVVFKLTRNFDSKACEKVFYKGIM
jgi:hypothetical protein